MFSCFVLRPLVMYLVSAPFDLDPMMRKVFVAATMLPVSSVIAVLARAHGADEEFASKPWARRRSVWSLHFRSCSSLSTFF